MAQVAEASAQTHEEAEEREAASEARIRSQLAEHEQLGSELEPAAGGAALRTRLPVTQLLSRGANRAMMVEPFQSLTTDNTPAFHEEVRQSPGTSHPCRGSCGGSASGPGSQRPAPVRPGAAAGVAGGLRADRARGPGFRGTARRRRTRAEGAWQGFHRQLFPKPSLGWRGSSGS